MVKIPKDKLKNYLNKKDNFLADASPERLNKLLNSLNNTKKNESKEVRLISKAISKKIQNEIDKRKGN